VGFFRIPEVTIIRDYGLIFDSSTGYMHENRDGTGIPGGSNARTTYGSGGFTPQWSGTPGELRLYGFSWNTSVPVSLTIVGDTKITLNGDSRFESTHVSGTGIKFGNGSTGTEVITITGTRTLTAVGNSTTGTGVNIHNGSLVINNGTFIAQAGRAVNWIDPPDDRVVADASVFDYSWTFSENFDGSDGDSGYGIEDPFVLNEEDKFVMFKTVTPVNLAFAEQLGGISHTADSVAVELTFSASINGLTADDITIFKNGTVKAEKGILSGAGRNWTLTLNSIDAEGEIGIEIKRHIGDYFIDSYQIDNIKIYKADPPVQLNIILTNTVQSGGYITDFEFEIIFVDDPRGPRVISLTTSPSDEGAYLVTYDEFDTPLLPGRITGTENNILLLKDGDVVKIHNLPIGFYYVSEHVNEGFVTAYNIDNNEWFTAPEGVSRVFRLDDSDISIEAFNSTVEEEPGEPERPFDPEEPDVVIEPESFNVLLSKTVQTGGDFEQLFEFELLYSEDNGEFETFKALSLSSDPGDEDTYHVTYDNGSWLPPGRIKGDDSSVLLIKHSETVLIRNLPIGYYFIVEYVNDGFITAFNMNNDEGWFTAPDGKSKLISHINGTSVIDCYNSIIPEEPGGSGEPEEFEPPEDPDDPEEPCDPENPCGDEDCEDCNSDEPCDPENPCNDEECEDCYPDEPCDPENPCNDEECEDCYPDEPCDPENPCDDEDCEDCKAESAGNQSNTGENPPQTGDDRDIVLPFIMIIFGIIVLMGSEIYRKKIKHN